MKVIEEKEKGRELVTVGLRLDRSLSCATPEKEKRKIKEK